MNILLYIRFEVSTHDPMTFRIKLKILRLTGVGNYRMYMNGIFLPIKIDALSIISIPDYYRQSSCSTHSIPCWQWKAYNAPLFDSVSSIKQKQTCSGTATIVMRRFSAVFSHIHSTETQRCERLSRQTAMFDTTGCVCVCVCASE